MEKKKKGLLARVLEEKKLRDEYVKNNPKTSRWQLFSEIFKGNFKQITRVNLWMLLFFMPTLIVIYINLLYGQLNATIYPFGSNLGVGYPANPELQGIAEWLTVQTGFYIFVGVLVTAPIATVGLAGGVHVVRKLLRGEALEKTTKPFFQGVKLNYKQMITPSILFCALLLLGSLLINLVDYNVASGSLSNGEIAWFKVAQVGSYIALVDGAVVFLWMISLNVNYEQSFFACVKNSFFLSLGTLPQTLFFGALSVAPFALFFISNVSIIISAALVCLILFSFSYAILVWLSFTQWVYDRYITPKQKRKAETAKKTEEKKGKSRLTSGGIKPLDDGKEVAELPQNYTRGDLKKIEENKKEMLSDADVQGKIE